VSDVGVTPWRAMPAVVKALTLTLIAAYAAFFFFASTETKDALVQTYGVTPLRFTQGSIEASAWLSLVAHVFFHGGWLHLGMNCIVLLQAAPLVAARLGAAQFIILFFVSAIGGGLAYVSINPSGAAPAIGASGAICGVFAAFMLAVRPTPKQALADPNVRNAIGMFLFINVGLAAAASMFGLLPIAWEAHLGGFIAGGALYPLLAPRWRSGPWG